MAWIPIWKLQMFYKEWVIFFFEGGGRTISFSESNHI